MNAKGQKVSHPLDLSSAALKAYSRQRFVRMFNFGKYIRGNDPTRSNFPAMCYLVIYTVCLMKKISTNCNCAIFRYERSAFLPRNKTGWRWLNFYAFSKVDFKWLCLPWVNLKSSTEEEDSKDILQPSNLFTFKNDIISFSQMKKLLSRHLL